jgi:MFS family permease
MTTSNRPESAAPSGMGGATRMFDPSEAAHDRTRRRCMNVAFVVIVIATLLQSHWVHVHGWDWLNVLLLIVAAMPLGLAVKIFELRFKMATTERQAVLRELPKNTKVGFAIYSLLAILIMAMQQFSLPWALWGIWLYDFVTYYHDRPERMRHLYAVTKTLDEIRDFRAPWTWALPALAWEIVRMTIIR